MKLAFVALVVVAPMLVFTNCAGPDEPQQADINRRDDELARDMQRRAERQERRSDRRTGRFDGGFTGNYGR